MEREKIREVLERLVPGKYAFARQGQIAYDPSLRTLCQANRCGKYGRSYTCPPAVGPVEELIARAGEYPSAALYQTVARLEDSFDYEGMMAAKAAHFDCSRQIQRELLSLSEKGFLHLSAGSCNLCPKCAIEEGQPCRSPAYALHSMEAYGIFVSRTAAGFGLPYINGENTVTYFGLILFEE